MRANKRMATATLLLPTYFAVQCTTCFTPKVVLLKTYILKKKDKKKNSPIHSLIQIA